MRITIRTLLLATCIMAFSRGSMAQGVGVSPSQPAGTTAMFSNPMMNPYINPYLASAMPNNPDFLLYMYSANQMNGGIGSGQISGTRAAPGQGLGTQGQSPGMMNSRLGQTSTSKNSARAGNRTRVQNNRSDALMPMASSIPGSGAAVYFNRGFNSNSGAGRFYNRTSARFQNNGR